MRVWKAAAYLACSLALFAAGPAVADSLDGDACRSARSAAFDRGPELTPRDMRIVAVGSSSTEGTARNARDKLYPAALQTTLGKLWPNARIEVVNRGKGGETMAQMLQRFETDVLALKPDLVIWQLGVNDVLRFDGVAGRREEIESGLKTLAERRIPVVLLDLQYAPAVLKDPDAQPMQAMIDEAARLGARGRVFHFRRYAAMKTLAEDHQVPVREMTDGDDLHMTDGMHACIGELLAEMISSKPLLAATRR